MFVEEWIPDNLWQMKQRAVHSSASKRPSTSSNRLTRLLIHSTKVIYWEYFSNHVKSLCWLCPNWPQCGFSAAGAWRHPSSRPPRHSIGCSVAHMLKLPILASAAGARRLQLSCHCVTSIVCVLTGCKSSWVSLIWLNHAWSMIEAVQTCWVFSFFVLKE